MKELQSKGGVVRHGMYFVDNLFIMHVTLTGITYWDITVQQFNDRTPKGKSVMLPPAINVI
jgi:hypothetical protein